MPFTVYKEPLNSITEQLCNDLLNICHGNPPSPQFMSYNLYTTTDWLLHELVLCWLVPGGGITGITGRKPIVIDNTIPAVPEVQFEIVRDTQANILAMQVAGTLADGGYYTITDMPTPLKEATFVAIFDSVAGKTMLQQWGKGIDTPGGQFEVGYDLATNFIFHLYNAIQNQRAWRQIGSANNCIENAEWTLGFWRNNTFNDCNIFNKPGLTFSIVQNSDFKQDSAIDFANINNCLILYCNAAQEAHLNFVQAGTIIDSNFEQFCIFNANTAAGNFNQLNIGKYSNIDTNTFTCFKTTIGNNFTIVQQGALNNETIIEGLSTVRFDLSAAANWAALLLTIPANLNYVGEFNLTDAAGGNINQIANLSLQFPTKFTCSPVVVNLFQPTNVPIAGNNDIVSDSPGVAPITLTGYGSTSDFIVFTKTTLGGGADANQVNYYSVNT